MVGGLPRLRLLGALLASLLALALLAGCDAASHPAGDASAAASTSATATATTQPTAAATPTPALAPTPANVPAAWAVLATTHFSIAYPSGWIVETLVDQQDYVIMSPTKQGEVGVIALQRADVKIYVAPYCQPASVGARRTTLAQLPMIFQLTGLADTVREWRFANAQQTMYMLSAGDATSSAAIQAQDAAILATFRPDNATPWSC